ncbi:MAG: Maf family protein, partial [Planctomycetota bacterium]
MAVPILLASQSPQRSELLQAAGIPFSVVASTTDESTINLPHPQACAVERAVAKALGVPRDLTVEHPDAVILAADTVASLNGQMIGKPRDREHAERTLQQLQGTTHVVSTAHCLLKADGAGTMSTVQAVGVAVAKVTMLPMSDGQIADYLASGEWAGRAGAYA